MTLFSNSPRLVRSVITKGGWTEPAFAEPDGAGAAYDCSYDRVHDRGSDRYTCQIVSYLELSWSGQFERVTLKLIEVSAGTQ